MRIFINEQMPHTKQAMNVTITNQQHPLTLGSRSPSSSRDKLAMPQVTPVWLVLVAEALRFWQDVPGCQSAYPRCPSAVDVADAVEDRFAPLPKWTVACNDTYIAEKVAAELPRSLRL